MKYVFIDYIHWNIRNNNSNSNILDEEYKLRNRQLSENNSHKT